MYIFYVLIPFQIIYINSPKIRFKRKFYQVDNQFSGSININSIEITPTPKRHLSRGVPLSGVTQHIPPPSVPDHKACSVVTNSLTSDDFSFNFECKLKIIFLCEWKG